jgi:superoxide dismutase, Cu-Zn family
MRTRLFVALIPLLFAAACDRTPPPAATPAPASDPAPASPGPGVRSEPMAGPAPAGTPAMADEAMPSGPAARVALEPTEGNETRGVLTLRMEAGVLVVSGHIDGLQPNMQHGFHIHENGDCSAPDASSAGDHFNPDGKPHGRVGTGEHHAGDMPNVRADGDGHAMVDARVEGLQLGSGEPHDVAGRAVVVHQNPDDYTSQPAGNAGARLACGVIQVDGR